MLVDEPPSVRYEVSPDGNWLALLDDSNRLCLVAVADLSARERADGISSTRAVWSPDSSKVVFFLSSIVIGESGPLGTPPPTARS